MPAGDDNLNLWASPTITAPLARSESSGDDSIRPSFEPFTLPNPVAGLLDADGSSFVMLALDGTPLAANQQALSLLGARSLDELSTGSAARGVLGSLLDHVPQQLLANASGPGMSAGGTWQGDFDHTDREGRHRIYRATVVVTHDDSSADGGHIGIITHDVTHSRD